ncbi:MAG: PD40 domain-containing protein [Bacteroidaceae bacterium]|nr:PD40 domain-containing protein [Bacteroidaceae bacterium]
MLMNRKVLHIAVIASCLLLAGCRHSSLKPLETSGAGESAAVGTPEASDVVIPYNIAPLNFCLDGSEYAHASIEVRGSSWVLSTRARRGRVIFPEKKWKRFLACEKGHRLTLSLNGIAVVDNSRVPWVGPTGGVVVSPDSIDAYVTYRLIDPGFEVWHRVEIRERDITGFGERVLSDWRHTDNSCMNCHTHADARGDLSFFHLRGKGGGTILNREGTLRKLTLKTDSMPVAATYGDLHPSGRYGVFSYNVVLPSLRMLGSNRMEVYDSESDLLVADFDTGRLLFSPLVSGTDELETFPTFSPDGRYVYFCRAPRTELPDSVSYVHYDIARIAFSPSTGTWGDSIETVWSGDDNAASASFPKLSPDGRWLLFCRSAFGTFPIWHRETSLQMMDMTTGAVDTLPQLAANASSSYHSWSSTGRWIAFASKRGDGIYGRIWFAHVDEEGRVGCPFQLPQRNPEHDRLFLKSYNIPDLGSSPVPFDARVIGRLRKDVPAEPFSAEPLPTKDDN